MHIGLTGTNASGKTTILNYLTDAGYQHYSLSDILRQELKQRNLETSRENLIPIGNELRNKFGASVLADRVIKNIRTDYSIIDSIRNPSEVLALRQLKNFILLALDAPIEVRFERAKMRQRQENATSVEEFRRMEDLEKSSNPNAQNIAACMKMADFQLFNDGSPEQLFHQLDESIATAHSRCRPNWDEYFMKMAFLVAERSTCLRHHVGAIIVKEKQVLSTGYNGAARNTKDCLELGCLREQMQIPSGTRHELCRGIHAEQNAIIQAARHGVNINQSTLYCTHSPCTICAKMTVNAGITRVVIGDHYPDILNMAKELYQESNVEFERIPIPPLNIRILR